MADPLAPLLESLEEFERTRDVPELAAVDQAGALVSDYFRKMGVALDDHAARSVLLALTFLPPEQRGLSGVVLAAVMARKLR